jgi:hypothetical protein
MQVANSGLEEGIDWNVHIETDQGRRKNSAIGSMLFLRGKDSFSADVSGFQNPRLYASWQRDPFQACYSKSSFNAYDKTATLLRYTLGYIVCVSSIFFY